MGVAAAVVVLVLLLLLPGLLGGDSGDSRARPAGSPGRSPTPAARSSSTAVPGRPDCPLRGLPAQAADTVDEIYAGGPYPYRQDGVIFDNRERRLPQEKHGYYHEFTVMTPGSADRGSRRIIVGGANTEAPEVLYYTGNHYASFCVVSGLD